MGPPIVRRNNHSNNPPYVVYQPPIDDSYGSEHPYTMLMISQSPSRKAVGTGEALSNKLAVTRVLFEV